MTVLFYQMLNVKKSLNGVIISVIDTFHKEVRCDVFCQGITACTCQHGDMFCFCKKSELTDFDRLRCF